MSAHVEEPQVVEVPEPLRYGVSHNYIEILKRKTPQLYYL